MKRVIITNVPNTNKALEVLQSVIGQISDGIWENTDSYTSYWYCADIKVIDGSICIVIEDSPYFSYFGHYRKNNYYRMSDNEVRKFFANKLRTIIRTEQKDNPNMDLSFKSANNTISNYIGYKEQISVGYIYNICKLLKIED